MTPDVPRVVFDCNVLLQAALSGAGPAFACLGHVDDGRITLLLSSETLAEIRHVLNRPKLQAKFRHLTPQRVERFLTHLERKGVLILEVPRAITLPRDPKDEPYINLAVAADAKFLITRDLDLLDLTNDSDFRRRFPNLKIVDPAAFLREGEQTEQRASGD